MVKILVTGGAGFIGANLVRMLIERSYQVVVLDDLVHGYLHYRGGLNLEFIKETIVNPRKVYEALQGVDSVVHLAAQTGIVDSVDHPYRNFAINVIGSFNLLDICRKMDVKRFVFASSIAATAYPVSPYAASKRAVEDYCSAYYETYGLKTISLRFANVYGPYSKHKNSVIAKWFNSIINQKSITIEGGEQTRDFIHVGDVCRAIITALESNISGDSFAIGTGTETSIIKLARMIGEQIDGIEMIYGGSRRNDVKRSFPNVSKSGLVLNWQSSVNLTDGLKGTWEWFLDNSNN